MTTSRLKHSWIAVAIAAPLCLGACAGDDATNDSMNDDGGTDTSADTGTDTGAEQQPCAPDQLDACPADSKCTAVEEADGLEYRYECVPDIVSLEPGEACEPSPPTGIDGCPSGYACIPDTNQVPTEGHCLQLCERDDTCLDGLCASRPTSPIPSCATYCEPLISPCELDEQCQLLEGRAFGCIFPLPDSTGVQGMACDGFNNLGCDEGFVCMNEIEVPDCVDADTDYCCTALCPLDGMSECPDTTMCIELDLDDHALFTNVGVCSV